MISLKLARLSRASFILCNTTGNDYGYWANGALKFDKNKGIDSIVYNSYLKKVSRVKFSSGKWVNFYYKSNGDLLKRKLSNGDVWMYRDDLLMKNDSVYQITHDEGRVIFDKVNNKWVSEFDYRDIWGNLRVSLRDSLANPVNGVYAPPVVVQAYDYDAFGLEVNSFLTTNQNNFKFQDKENMSDFGLDWINFGARSYDRLVGRWTQIDPLSHKMPSYSGYSFNFNNPLKFIDFDGRIPYPITIRSFAPFQSFGGGFHGDGSKRGFTTSQASARIHQNIQFDTEKKSISTIAWSDKSFHPLLGEARAIPNLKINSYTKADISSNVSRSDFQTSVSSANPLTPKGTPNINVESQFSITSNENNNTLSVRGVISGDNFPSTEAFIKDQSGQSVFLGVGFYEGDPYSSLAGENNQRLITDFNVVINLDDKGNFKGVTQNNKNYSISDWNKKFENANPHDKNSKK